MNRWDKYWLNMCKTVASNSKCLSRQIGAVIVRDKSLISTGYNGPARGIPHCGDRYFIDDNLKKAIRNHSPKASNIETCPRQTLGFESSQGLEWCIAGHAERNSIINAAREGVKVKGAIMYMDCGIPCTPCLIEIINAGISEIVVTALTTYDSMSQFHLDNSNLKVREYEV